MDTSVRKRGTTVARCSTRNKASVGSRTEPTSVLQQEVNRSLLLPSHTGVGRRMGQKGEGPGRRDCRKTTSLRLRGGRARESDRARAADYARLRLGPPLEEPRKRGIERTTRGYRSTADQQLGDSGWHWLAAAHENEMSTAFP